MRHCVLVSILLAACSHDDDSLTSGGADDAASADDGGGEVGTPCDGAAMHDGEATDYDFADGSGNCGFPATPNDLMVGAMNHVDYAGSAVCGSCVRIDGPNGSVDVRIVDQCPECPEGNIDLSPDAFAKIAALEAGRVPIAWQYTSCNVTGPVVYHFKDGSNAYWTAVQLRNHRDAIAKFEVQQGGAYVDVARVDYNYFVKDDGMGDGPFDFRITDVAGNTLEDHGIPLLDDADAPGSGQFSACGG